MVDMVNHRAVKMLLYCNSFMHSGIRARNHAAKELTFFFRGSAVMSALHITLRKDN